MYQTRLLEKQAKAVRRGLVQDVYPLLYDMIEIDNSPDVYWYEEHIDGEQSKITSLQLFSNKSDPFMEASGVTFCSLHINFMKCSGTMQCIVSENFMKLI